MVRLEPEYDGRNERGSEWGRYAVLNAIGFPVVLAVTAIYVRTVSVSEG